MKVAIVGASGAVGLNWCCLAQSAAQAGNIPSREKRLR